MKREYYSDSISNFLRSSTEGILGILALNRVYFGRHGQTVVILLCGGSKKTQAADIKTAKEYWADWKRRQI